MKNVEVNNDTEDQEISEHLRQQGSKANNIVMTNEQHEGKDHFGTVLKDSMDKDPARRYKAIGWSSYDWDGPMSGIYTAVSPDGLHWTVTPEPVFHYHPRPGTDDLGPVGTLMP